MGCHKHNNNICLGTLEYFCSAHFSTVAHISDIIPLFLMAYKNVLFFTPLYCATAGKSMTRVTKTLSPRQAIL